VTVHTFTIITPPPLISTKFNEFKIHLLRLYSITLHYHQPLLFTDFTGFRLSNAFTSILLPLLILPFSQDRPQTSNYLLTLIICPDLSILPYSVCYRQGRWSQSLQVRSSYDLELCSTKYQATTIHWLFQTQSQNSPLFPPLLVMFPTLLYASASDSSSLEFVRYIHSVILIIIITTTLWPSNEC